MKTRPPEQLLAQWRDVGLLTDEQVESISLYDAAQTPTSGAMPLPGITPEMPLRRIPVVAETLGYIGAILAVVGLRLVVSRYWPQMALGTRLALSTGTAVALLVAGFAVRATDPALARLRGVLWLGSTAAAALGAGVLAADGIRVAEPRSVVLASAGAVAIENWILWRLRDRPLQQLTALTGSVIAIGAVVAHATGPGGIGLAVWGSGALLLAVGARHLTIQPIIDDTVGALAMMVGALICSSAWPGTGILLGLGTSVVLIGLALVREPLRSRPEQVMVGIIGAVALLESGPSTVGYFTRDAAVLTGALTWLGGGLLLAVGLRRLVRLPLVVEILGGALLIGGGALIGFESPGIATVVGTATAVGLLVIGMTPGRVLLSVFGSVGLLVNVPWAITWYFPGEGRVPLLIFVSGALIVAIAVLLTRRGHELRGHRGTRKRRVNPA